MTDILTDQNGELLIENGDFVIGESDFQNQQFLLVFQKGELKENPDVGVGIVNYLSDDEIEQMLKEVRVQFEKDGMSVDSISFDEILGKLNYDAEYKSL